MTDGKELAERLKAEGQRHADLAKSMWTEYHTTRSRRKPLPWMCRQEEERAATLTEAADRLLSLEGENERLNAAIHYEQHRAGRIGTHGPGCAFWGPQHYECATYDLQSAQAQIKAKDGLIDMWLAAMETGRSEPLFIARDCTLQARSAYSGEELEERPELNGGDGFAAAGEAAASTAGGA